MNSSADGVLYVLHGPRVDATTDGSGAPVGAYVRGRAMTLEGLERRVSRSINSDATTDGSGASVTLEGLGCHASRSII